MIYNHNTIAIYNKTWPHLHLALSRVNIIVCESEYDCPITKPNLGSMVTNWVSCLTVKQADPDPNGSCMCMSVWSVHGASGVLISNPGSTTLGYKQDP